MLTKTDLKEIRKIVQLETNPLVKRFDEMERKFDEKIDTFAIIVKNQFDRVDDRFDGVENRLDKVENRLERVEYNTGTFGKIQNNHENRITYLEDGSRMIKKKLKIK
jgi:archaellum component FlaC